MSMRDWTREQRQEFAVRARERSALKRQQEVDQSVTAALNRVKDKIFMRIATEGLENVGLLISEEFDREGGGW